MQNSRPRGGALIVAARKMLREYPRRAMAIDLLRIYVGGGLVVGHVVVWPGSVALLDWWLQVARVAGAALLIFGVFTRTVATLHIACLWAGLLGVRGAGPLILGDQSGGLELIVLFCVALAGAGRLSLDWLIRSRRRGVAQDLAVRSSAVASGPPETIKYLLGSSYFENGKNGPEFRGAYASYWNQVVWRVEPAPSRVVIICEAGSVRPNRGDKFEKLGLSGDLGSYRDLVEGRKPYRLSGWSASMLSTAMLAYVDESDFIYLEEDCLAFGPWVKRMYQELGDGSMIFGMRHESPPWAACSQSLFLVRHAFIPEFVEAYIHCGDERKIDNLGELKFCQIERMFNSRPGLGRPIRRLSFGVDRCRPLPYGDEVWYAQQLSAQELAEIVRRGLLDPAC